MLVYNDPNFSKNIFHPTRPTHPRNESLDTPLFTDVCHGPKLYSHEILWHMC